MRCAKRLMFLCASALALLGGVLPLVTTATAQQIHSNLILNHDFEGFSDWTLLDVPLWGNSLYDPDLNCNSFNPTGCLKASVTPIASSGDRRVSSAWQCVNVEPERAYGMALDIHGNLANPGNSSARMILVDVTGVSCPQGDAPPPIGDSFASAFLFEPFGWGVAYGTVIIPTGVTRVAAALHSNTGSSSEEAQFSFDNAELGKLRPDMSVQMAVSATELEPLELFTIELTYDSQYNGTQADLRVFHQGRISLVEYDCDAGSIVDVAQGDDYYLRWFSIPDDPEPHQHSCTITARVNGGFSGSFNLQALADCEGCDAEVNPGNNEVTIPIEIPEAPDIEAAVSVAELPEAGSALEIAFSLENHGTSSGPVLPDVSVVLGVPLELESANGTYCFLSQTVPGVVEGSATVNPSSVTDCVLTFLIPDSQPQADLSVEVLSLTAGDYDSSNDGDQAATRIVNLLVDTTDEGFDGDPGDGFCSQVTGSEGCSVRAAVMEASALAAATGRSFTVRVPHTAQPYTLNRTVGDGSQLYGSLLVNRSMSIVGLPDGDGNLPTLLADFPEVDADRLVRIANPAAFVRIENINLSGQGLVPTDTDGLGTDGGLIVHHSGALHLVNVGLSNGVTDGRGGAIYSASDDTNGDLVLQDVRVHDNTAGQGGAVAFVPESGLTTLGLEQSELFNNEAQTGGGIFAAGVHATALPALSILQSSLYDNHALGGGGAAWLNNVLLASIDNSTISGNVAEISGGGIGLVQDTSLAINNSTIAFNQARPGDPGDGLGGGLFIDSAASVTLYNSLVSSNTAQEACSQPQPTLPPICVPRAANCYGSVDSAGYNAMAGDADCSFVPQASDDNTNVELAALTDNGGPTPTHAPAAFSWIVDAGDPACLDRPGGESLLIDQRGALRPADGDEDTTAQCDRGAFELSDNARVSVVVDDAALGRVQSSPNGIWCGEGTNDSCSALFGLDASVVLTATAASGAGGEFIGWEGACAGQGANCTVTAAGDVETTALFGLANQPDFLVGCEGGNIVEVPEGGTAQVNCSVESVNGYSQLVSLDCLESASSIDCQVSAASVTPPADGSRSFAVSIDTGQTAPGDYLLLIEGSDGGRMRQAALGLTVSAPFQDGLFSDRFEP